MSDTNSLRRKANALYLAVPESVADDVIPDIRQAADAIDALTAQVAALTAQRDEAVRLIRLAEPGPLTAATRWWDESAALLRGVKR